MMQLPSLDRLNTYFNFKIAKLFATFLVLSFILYHGMLHAIDGKILTLDFVKLKLCYLIPQNHILNISLNYSVNLPKNCLV